MKQASLTPEERQLVPHGLAVRDAKRTDVEIVEHLIMLEKMLATAMLATVKGGRFMIQLAVESEDGGIRQSVVAYCDLKTLVAASNALNSAVAAENLKFNSNLNEE